MSINKDIKAAITDRLEGWELIDFLQIDIETIVDVFEDEIEENLQDVLEFCGVKGLDSDEEE